MQFAAATVFQAEHIEPQSSFAPGDPAADHEDNLAWACPRCNQGKRIQVDGVDPADGQRCRLFNPRIDTWSEHFVALPSGRIEGTSAIGRATEQALNLNVDPNAVSNRAQLGSRGEWPAR
jgi:rubredoxin